MLRYVCAQVLLLLLDCSFYIPASTLHRTTAATVQADISLMVLLDFANFLSGILFVTTAGRACNNIVILITQKDPFLSKDWHKPLF